MSDYDSASNVTGTPVAQKVKCWLTDLGVPGLSPARGLDFFNRKLITQPAS